MAGTCCARYFSDYFVHERMLPPDCRCGPCAAALGSWLCNDGRRARNARGDAAAKKHYRILCVRAEPRWRFCVAPWALPRNQKVSQQTKLGRVAESLRLTGKGFIKCFSTLSFFFSQVAYSPSPLQRRSPPSAKTYERSLTWSQRLRCLIRNRCHETVRRRSASGWTATQPQRDASVLQSGAGAMSISPRWAIEPRC